MTRPVSIAGGGIAGLSLGIALRRADVPVEIVEASTYPRHRLCGEFISGAGPQEFTALGLPDLAQQGEVLTDAVWYSGNARLLHRTLPEPALGISRWRLDAVLAAQFTETGGNLSTGRRAAIPDGAEGWVKATGRARTGTSEWLGEKMHYRHLPLEAGLEMHLGRGGYAGLSRVEDGTVNVCALLPAAIGRELTQATLAERLRACGLGALAARLESAEPVEASHCGVSHFQMGWQPTPPGTAAVGDHCAIIPPFTGHGMSMGILGALAAAPALTAWSTGRATWPETVAALRQRLEQTFSRRLRWAAWLHPLLLRPAGRQVLSLLARTGLLPWRWLYHRVR